MLIQEKFANFTHSLEFVVFEECRIETYLYYYECVLYFPLINLIKVISLL